ncbi:tripeptide aminopeptidase PepT [Crenobacter caeni]|uniref:Peptidase T n=1 Tax=Crenobacter caeni TaxID=2705474 RepID=A0A6B2KQ46_9NEIS|nr:tripeptide aminopeptidase PepT [Crenobacter caeni]NDV12270.1 peptidase T [Crenobacter caeni]
MPTAVSERFLRYAAIDSSADPASTSQPSSAGQRALGALLAEELLRIGLSDVVHDATGCVSARLPATAGAEHAPAIAWIAHLDTDPAAGAGVATAQEIPAWPGRAVKLGDGAGRLSLRDTPALRLARGDDLIAGDGHARLGVDDKAGIAEIVSACARLVHAPAAPHGEIWVVLLPDAHLGRAAAAFPRERVRARWGYTVDAGALGELCSDSFNTTHACLTFEGDDCPPGAGYGRLVNAATLAALFHAGMPRDETPEATRGLEGYFHLESMAGNTGHAELHYQLCDFVAEGLACRERFLGERAAAFNAELDRPRVTLTLGAGCRNLAGMQENGRRALALARAAMADAGVTARPAQLRDCSLGARIGLPCPGLFAGGFNVGSTRECVSVQAMERAVDVLEAIAYRAAREAAPSR